MTHDDNAFIMAHAGNIFITAYTVASPSGRVNNKKSKT